MAGFFFFCCCWWWVGRDLHISYASCFCSHLSHYLVLTFNVIQMTSNNIHQKTATNLRLTFDLLNFSLGSIYWSLGSGQEQKSLFVQRLGLCPTWRLGLNPLVCLQNAAVPSTDSKLVMKWSFGLTLSRVMHSSDF